MARKTASVQSDVSKFHFRTQDIHTHTIQCFWHKPPIVYKYINTNEYCKKIIASGKIVPLLRNKRTLKLAFCAFIIDSVICHFSHLFRRVGVLRDAVISIKYFEIMPKKESQNDRAKRYFTLLNKDENAYECNIEGCARKIIANNAFKFVSHIKFMHKSIYSTNVNQEAVDETTIKLKRLQLIQYCAEIVSVNGRPLNYLRDSGFQNIIKDQVAFLNSNNASIDFYHLKDVRDYLFDVESKMREIVKNEEKDRFVSLMVDVGSKNTASILAICAQFMINCQIQFRNIGMKQLHKRHKSSYIKQMVEEQLHDFGINKFQVISFTTDNASNMRATVRLFDDDIFDDDNMEDEEQEEYLIERCVENLRIDTEAQNIHSDVRLREIIHQNSNIDDNAVDDTLLSILDDQSVLSEVAEAIELDFRRFTFNVSGIPCSAHTLQLAVNEALKIPTAEITIRGGQF